MEYAFRTSFAKFIKENKFTSVTLLNSAISPVKRERESNREIPEIFGFASSSMETAVGGSYYEKFNIRKFGFWLGADKKKELQELDEMNGDSAKKLIRLFNKEDIKAQLFVIFTTGGIDFVGGYTYFNLLKLG